MRSLLTTFKGKLKVIVRLLKETCGYIDFIMTFLQDVDRLKPPSLD